MPSFYIPLSGLDADNTALNTIANNLSNMNTTGFKAQTTNFSDLFYQQVGTTGAGGEIQQGTGVQVASNSTDFTEGSISSTGISTDVAINGTGFFVLDNGGGAQLYTRNGNFQLSSTGVLESTEGQAVMGYPAANGVINTSGALSEITLPTGQVMPPSATTSLSMTQNLNSSSPIGTQTTGQVQIYDSLGNSYEATVTYTNLGDNQWSYAITLPDTLSATEAAAGVAKSTVTPTTATSGTNTIYTYNFGSSNGTLATVDGSSTLSIGASSVTIPAAGESVSSLAAQINALGVAGVSASVNNGILTVTAPTATTVTSSITQDLAKSTISYSFGSNGGTLATVDAGTNLTISGLNASGASATCAAPTVTAGESLATYAAALTAGLSAAGVTGITVAVNGGVLSITGTNLTTSGSVIQDPLASASAHGTLTFNSSGNLISPAVNISNITFAGLSDNANNMDLTWNLYGANGTGNITQTDAASGQTSQNQNGYASGEYQSFSIGSDGTVTATYSNGQSQSVGQLAIATVSNQQGLVDVGSTEYQATTSSGLATVGVAGSGGRGTLEGASLEASNVNISAEFSDLIVAQRAFEANAKSVTTFDTITQETINMIH